MPKKYTYEIVKKEFEDRGYKLISTEYIGCEHKLQFKCKKHLDEGIQEIDFNHFHNRKQGCRYCGYEKVSKSKRVDCTLLKEITELKGFIYCGYEYIDGSANIKFICKNHIDRGIQILSYMNMKKSKGRCQYCIGRYKTTKEFKKELKLKNKNIEILGEYIDSTTKIKCKCLKDNHIWYTKPSLLLSGAGCPKCGIELSRINSSKTHEQFISEMKIINPNVEFLTKYTNVKKKIKCRCLIDGYEWTTTPDSLLGGRGCHQCAKQKLYDTQVKSNEQFLSELYIVNPNIQPLEKYYNDHTKIKCKCLIHDYEWYAAPNKILHRKTGCPKCASYHNENKLDDILENWGFKYIAQKRYKDCKDKYTLPFDRYLPDFGILIEYDGEGHSKPIRRGSMSEDDAIRQFEYVKKHDDIKNKYCKTNNIPLIRIPYWERKDMEYYLFDQLVKCGAIEEIKSA